MKKTRGIGSVYRPKYRNDSTGELQESAVWWIRYSHHGVKHRESSKSEVRKDASDLLKLRIGQAGMGKPVTAAIRRTALDDLAGLVLRTTRTTSSIRWRVRKTPSIIYGSSFAVTVSRMTRGPPPRVQGMAPTTARWSRCQAKKLSPIRKLHASAARWRRSTASSQPYDMRLRWQRATRPRWSRPCPISSCRRSGTGASVFLNGTSSSPCVTICPTIYSRS